MKLTSNQALQILENFRGTTQSDRWTIAYVLVIVQGK